MPSPFPGMDPYLEDPAVWPDFHDRFAEQLSAALNESLPEPYYAQLRQREEIGIAGESIRRIVPDVSVHRDRQPQSGAVTSTGPRLTVSESIEIISEETPEVNYVEIVDADSDDEVVTLIEILSPSNKVIGPDHDQYLRKRNDILRSDTSLIEIDLLREGDRTFYGGAAWSRIRQLHPPADYLVFVSRAWKPRIGGGGELFPIPMTASLPVISVPLRESIPEVPIDLQHSFQLTYDRGPYRRRIDYASPPVISLPGELQEWAESCLRGS